VSRTPTNSAVAIAAPSVALLQPTGQACASGQDIRGPAMIPAESVRLADSSVGGVPAPLPLTAAGFMQAEPSRQADLKPSSTTRTNGNTFVTWVFEGAYPQCKWLSRDYAGGIASLSRRILPIPSPNVLSSTRRPSRALRLSTRSPANSLRGNHLFCFAWRDDWLR
jgi:hypothetical protein